MIHLARLHFLRSRSEHVTSEAGKVRGRKRAHGRAQISARRSAGFKGTVRSARQSSSGAFGPAYRGYFVSPGRDGTDSIAGVARSRASARSDESLIRSCAENKFNTVHGTRQCIRARFLTAVHHARRLLVSLALAHIIQHCPIDRNENECRDDATVCGRSTDLE